MLTAPAPASAGGRCANPMTNDGARSTEAGATLDSPATDPPAKPPLWTPAFTLNAFGTIGFFGSFFYLVSVLPDYVDSIGGSKWQIGLIVGGFGFVPMLLRPFVGRWSDRGHRKRLQLIGLLTMAAATGLMVFSEDIISLFLLRIAQGVGMALFPTAAASLAAELAPPLRRGEGLGYFGMATGFAQMVTPALGVTIAALWGFDAVFLVAAGTSLATLLVVQPIREPVSKARAELGSGLIPRRAIFPMLIFLSVTFSFVASSAFLPLHGADRGLGNVGLFFLVSGAGAIVSRPLAGRLSDRLGRVPVTVPGLLLTCAGMWLVAVAQSPLMLWFAAACTGLGLGASHTGLLSLAVDRVPVNEKGRAAAVLQLAWDIGGLTGAVILGVVATLLGIVSVYWTAGVIVLAATAALLVAAARGVLAMTAAD